MSLQNRKHGLPIREFFFKKNPVFFLAIVLLSISVLTSATMAESYYGLPVVATKSGYKIVDIRPILSSLTYQNSRAKKEWRYASSTMAICDVSIKGWKSAPGSTHTGITIPSGSTYFSFTPSRNSSCFMAGAMYYQNGKWIAVQAGATRENNFCSIYDIKDGKYWPAGALFSDWCTPWTKSLPTVAVLIDVNCVFMSYGVVLNKSATVTPYPSAPSNTYKLISSNLTWTQAKADAASRGGYLATITSPAEWNNIVSQLGSGIYNKNIWIGATDAASEGTWTWITGETWYYSNWASGQPNNLRSKQHYGRITGSTGTSAQWDDVENATQPYYLLETTGSSTTPVTPVTPTVPAPSNTYQLISGTYTWSQAKSDAQTRGGYLVTITSAAEWQNIVTQIGSGIYNKDCWIGATDEGTEGVWRWVSGEAWSYANWSQNQPNNVKSIQHYARIWGSTGTKAQWDDIDNASLSYYILEKTGTTTPPSTPTTVVSYTSVYQLVKGSYTWTAAKADAVKRGGYLASIRSADEWLQIVSQLAFVLSGKDFWIGASDAGSEGSWYWASGESWNYSNWMTGQPNNLKKAQHYAHIYFAGNNSNGQWDDINNSTLSYYLLEIRQAITTVVSTADSRLTKTSASARKASTVKASVQPDSVLTSDGAGQSEAGWLACDGDLETAWAGSSKVQGGWIAMTYEEEVCVKTLTLDLGEQSLTNILYLGSADSREWFDLGQTLATNGPACLHYLWIVFADDASGRAPAIREIRVNEP